MVRFKTFVKYLVYSCRHLKVYEGEVEEEKEKNEYRIHANYHLKDFVLGAYTSSLIAPLMNTDKYARSIQSQHTVIKIKYYKYKTDGNP